MIANLCKKNGTETAANLAFAMPDVREELADPLKKKTIAKEVLRIL